MKASRHIGRLSQKIKPPVEETGEDTAIQVTYHPAGGVHRGDNPQRFGSLRRRVEIPSQRHPYRHHRPTTESLDHPPEYQHHQRDTRRVGVDVELVANAQRQLGRPAVGDSYPV